MFEVDHAAPPTELSFRSIGKRDSWGAALLAMLFVGGDLQALRSLSRA